MKHPLITIAAVFSGITHIWAAPLPHQIAWSGDLDPADPTSWNSTTAACIGNTQDGSLTIANGGFIHDYSGCIGNDANATGTVTIKDSGSSWVNSGWLSVGEYGTGILNVENGASVYNFDGYIGYAPGARGTATINGPGSSWANSSWLSVGEYGTGTLVVTNGGTVYNVDGYLGYTPYGSGTATVTGSGSVWSNTSWLSVGEYGTGTMMITNGGAVYGSEGYAGYNFGATGTVTVTGAESVWSSAGYLGIGEYGTGTMHVENGGAVFNHDGCLGFYYGTTGRATVTDQGSIWSNSAHLYVGYYGTGALTVKDSGRVYAGGSMYVGSGSSVTLASGGTVHIEGDATLNPGSQLNFELSDQEESGRMTVGGSIYNYGTIIKLTSTDPLQLYSEFDLIQAGSIVDPFNTFDTNNILSVYNISLSSTATNVTATVHGVKVQGTDTPSIAKASAASMTVVANNISKHTGITRSRLRNRNTAASTPAGPTGAQGRLASGEWVAYMRQFNDLGGQDSEGERDGFDWQTSGYMLGMEQLVNEQLLIGFGTGQSWTDLDGLRNSGGGSTKMLITSLYGNWFNETAYCEAGLLYARADNDTERIDTALDRYKGRYDSDMFGGWIEAGWLARKTDRTELEPYARSTYISGNQDGYTDEGGRSPMTISANGTDNWLIEGGTRLSREWKRKNAMKMRLEIKAGVQCELLDNRVTVNSVVANTNQRASSPEADRVALLLGARADVGLTDSLNIGVGYEPTLAGNWQNHLIDFTLSYKF